MKKLLLLPVLLSTGFYAFAQKQANFADTYSQAITPAGIKQKLTIVAGPEMEGRETASAGQKKAAAYIENHFKKLGLLPGTTGGYQMQFPVYQDTLLEANLKVNDKDFNLYKDFSLNIGSAANGTVDIKEVVFASYGIMDSLRNDYKDIDVKGKWILIVEGSPSEENVANRRSLPSNTSKIKLALMLGAKGVFIMSADLPKKITVEAKGSMYLKMKTVPDIPSITVSTDLAHYLLGLNPERLLENIKNILTGTYNTNVQFTINKRTLLLQSSNVIALLPGTDKKDEYVFITAHYDHLGIKGKEIFYGADDDGSGTTGVLQIAEAYAKAKNEGHGPRRSIVFMTVSGEEKGLFGSEYYSQYPAFPLSKTSADLNIDMVGRIDPNYKGDSLNYVYVIGDDKLSSDLRPITDSVNNVFLKIELSRKYNDLKDPNRFYYRSDHYNFAKNGVPVIFYFNGVHADYHRSTDTVDKIKFDLMAKRLKLVFFTSWDIANRNEMVKRDIPLVK